MPYEDASFAPEWALGEALEVKHAADLVWLRASDAPGSSLFGSAIAPEDVLEGELDDCYLVGAMTLLSLRPGSVRSLFDLERSDDTDGRYCVLLWRRGEQLVVEIDDRIPCPQVDRCAYLCPEQERGRILGAAGRKGVCKAGRFVLQPLWW